MFSQVPCPGSMPSKRKRSEPPAGHLGLVTEIARQLGALGVEMVATDGTREALAAEGMFTGTVEILRASSDAPARAVAVR